MNNTALEFRSAKLPLFSPSDAGDLATEWPLVLLGELCSFANGVNANKDAYGKGIPFANVLEIITHSHLHSSEIPGRVLLSKLGQERFAVRRGDVLFNRTSETQSEVGLAAVYDDSEPIVFGGFVIRGRFNIDAFDRTYVGYALRAPIVRSQIISQGQGAIRANIGQSNLKRILIPLPSKLEQRAIAAALSDVDEMVGALEALIAKKRAIKQATMQELLTGKTRLPEFSGEWVTKRLKEIAEVRTGPFGSALHERDYVAEGTPIITVEHLGERGVICTNLPLVSDTDRARLGAYSLVAGDIVFSRVGSIDRNALIRSREEGWLFSGRLLRVRPDNQRISSSISATTFTENNSRLVFVKSPLDRPWHHLTQSYCRGLRLRCRNWQSNMPLLQCCLTWTPKLLPSKLVVIRQMRLSRA